MRLEDFQSVTTFLSAATLADPFLALCSAVAWLDPLSIQDESLIDEGYYGGGDDWSNIGVAWEVSRNCFPEVYAEITQAIRAEPDPRRLADSVCSSINAHLVGGELHDLEQIYFGLPFFGRGIDVADAEFFAAPQYTPLVEVYAMLGVTFDPAKTYSVPDGMYESAQVAEILSLSLDQTGNKDYEKLSSLLTWMYGFSQNSVVSLTEEDVYEMGIQPLEWNPVDLEFSNYMHAEAAEIIDDAMGGLDLLMSNESLQSELRANYQIVAKQMKKEKKHDRNQPNAERLGGSLRWTDRAQHPHEQRPADGAQNLQVRGADAA